MPNGSKKDRLIVRCNDTKKKGKKPETQGETPPEHHVGIFLLSMNHNGTLTEGKDLEKQQKIVNQGMISIQTQPQ